MSFVHEVRPRYAEVDAQGVVFNAHWLTYFDDACTRFFEWMGFPPATAFFRDFDLMVVKATIEWQGPAGFDEHVRIGVEASRLGTSSLDLRIGVEASRLGTSSLDLRYTATVADRPVCVGTITYVSVEPGTHESTPIPPVLREKLEATTA